MAKGGGGGVHVVAAHAHRAHQVFLSGDCFCYEGRAEKQTSEGSREATRCSVLTNVSPAAKPPLPVGTGDEKEGTHIMSPGSWPLGRLQHLPLYGRGQEMCPSTFGGKRDPLGYG